MPPSKPQRIYAREGTTLEEAKRTLQPSINKLLTLANSYPGGPADCALDALVTGQEYRSEELWPGWAILALKNIESNILTDDYHLRRCKYCFSWMLVKDNRRYVCNRDECRRIKKARQQQKFRAARRAQLLGRESPF